MKVITRPFVQQLDAEYKEALVRHGFEPLGGRIEFKSPVAQLPQETANPIDWRPVLAEEELPAVAAIFRDAVENDPHALDVVQDPIACIKEALSESGLTNGLSGIQIGYINDQPAAYIHVQIEAETGWSRITYMGILKNFRGKGLGDHVHRHGFTVMRELGGTLYHGGTSTENTAMIRLFEKNGCTKYCEMREWRLDLQKIRESVALSELETQRLRLEPMQASHAAECFELFQDEKIYPYICREPPLNLQTFTERFAFVETRLSPDLTEGWWNWVCIDKTTNCAIGTIEITYHREKCEAFLAYTVFPTHWRKGFAKEGCAAVIDFLFAKKDVKKIIIEMDVRNTASVALAESLKAKRVSYNENVQTIHGEWSHEYRYEIECIEQQTLNT